MTFYGTIGNKLVMLILFTTKKDRYSKERSPGRERVVYCLLLLM